MKAYKCDICGNFCNIVYTIHGITKPLSHKTYTHHEGGQSFDCCPKCYDEIMTYIDGMIAEAEGNKKWDNTNITKQQNLQKLINSRPSR